MYRYLLLMLRRKETTQAILRFREFTQKVKTMETLSFILEPWDSIILSFFQIRTLVSECYDERKTRVCRH